MARRVSIVLLAWAALAGPGSAGAQERPNIVLMWADNLGWGEVGAYGSVKGDLTPRIDRMAAEGIRLNNFNVESACTVSRIALLTARYAARTGGTQGTGMTLWEVTMAEALKSVGYATGHFGKWHVGGDNWIDGRHPQHQGFDEWYGIPGTSHVAQFSSFPNWDSTRMEPEYIWEGQAGGDSRKVKVYDIDTRRTVDREAAQRGIQFMERNVAARRPFFFYYPMTQIHFPTLAHPDFAGTTGAGDIGDAMRDVDHNVGLVLDAIDRLGIARNTIVFWCTDGGAEGRRPWRGSSGPWRGFYTFPSGAELEGGVRTPCIIRWPGRIPAGRVTNEIIHQVDFFPTLAAAAGRPEIVPSDRAIDGVNQLAFLEGKQPRSARQSAIWMQGDQVQTIKWRNWKLHYQIRPEPGEVNQSTLQLFNLLADPKEESDVKDLFPWVKSVMDGILNTYLESTKKHPNVPRGAKDPYVPPGAAT